jgi:beta-glucosidase
MTILSLQKTVTPNPDRIYMRSHAVALLVIIMAFALLGQSRQGNPLYKNPMAPIQTRVDDLLSRMTLEEKVAQMQCIRLEFDMERLMKEGKGDSLFGPSDVVNGMGQYSVPSFSAGKNRHPGEHANLTNAIQRYFIERSRLGIPIMFHEEALHGFNAIEATNYPTPLALAGTWDPGLVRKVFTQAALEARTRGTHEVLAPVIDLGREPRWGRTEETYGEDPYLVSRMGVAAVQGFQGSTLPLIDGHHVAATLKHFAAHGSPEAGRNTAPGVADERTFLDVLLRPFKAAVQEAGVKCVMPSYNEYNGVPSHANRALLTGMLRDEWGFKGAVVSDWFAIPGIVSHGLAANDTDATILALKAGVDMDLPTIASYRFLTGLVRAGKIDPSLVDRSVRRLLQLKFELGLFDHPYADPDEAERYAGCSEHRATAQEAAEKAVTLLKNDGNLLPLDLKALRKIAVIGPNADRPENGNYANEPKHIVTVLEAMRERCKGKAEVLFSQGVRLLRNNGTSDTVRLEDPDTNAIRIQEAVRVAQQSDLVILCLGAQKEMQREAWADYHRGDNASLELRSSQNDLVRAIRLTGKPVVVLLFSGTPLAFEEIDRTIPSILECWYLGQEAGTAVANVLFGNVNPGGKLPITLAASEGQLPVYYNHKPSRMRNYIFDRSEPLYPFGYGLSYTSFVIDSVWMERTVIRKNESVKVFARVRNTGNRKGDEVVQMYVHDVVASVTRPVKELQDFRRVTIDAGGTTTVQMEITPDKLSFHDITMRYGVEPGDVEVMIGTSSRDTDLKKLVLRVAE